MVEEAKNLLDWSQWGRQWIEHLRKHKTLNRELERHLHKFEETFTRIGRQASKLDSTKDSVELPALITRAEQVQEQFHHFLRLAQLSEDDQLEEEAKEPVEESIHGQPAVAEEVQVPVVPEPVSYPGAREPVRAARPVGVGRHTLPRSLMRTTL